MTLGAACSSGRRASRSGMGRLCLCRPEWAEDGGGIVRTHQLAWVVVPRPTRGEKGRGGLFASSVSALNSRNPPSTSR